MASRRTFLMLATVAAFIALLAYTTLGSQNVECHVVMQYDGRQNAATASAANAEDAERQARTAACGPIAPGMEGSIACTNRPPVERSCRTL